MSNRKFEIGARKKVQNLTLMMRLSRVMPINTHHFFVRSEEKDVRVQNGAASSLKE